MCEARGSGRHRYLEVFNQSSVQGGATHGGVQIDRHGVFFFISVDVPGGSVEQQAMPGKLVRAENRILCSGPALQYPCGSIYAVSQHTTPRQTSALWAANARPHYLVLAPKRVTLCSWVLGSSANLCGRSTTEMRDFQGWGYEGFFPYSLWPPGGSLVADCALGIASRFVTAMR